jgi:hypothetical protein
LQFSDLARHLFVAGGELGGVTRYLFVQIQGISMPEAFVVTHSASATKT